MSNLKTARRLEAAEEEKIGDPASADPPESAEAEVAAAADLPGRALHQEAVAARVPGAAIGVVAPEDMQGAPAPPAAPVPQLGHSGGGAGRLSDR